jgi:hypothetical protein
LAPPFVMRILLFSFLTLSAFGCSSAEPTRPYAPEIDPASPHAQEPDYHPPPDPLKQRVVPSASAVPTDALPAVEEKRH